MFLQKIEVENLLSFKKLELELHPLNVLIGANASGKSNVLRAFALLRSLPNRSESGRFLQGSSWSNKRTNKFPEIKIHAEELLFEYSLRFSEAGIFYESLKDSFLRTHSRFDLGTAKNSPIDSHTSVLAAVRHPDEPMIGAVADALERIALYREFRTGPDAPARHGISTHASGNFLQEDGGNLARVLGRLRGNSNHLRFIEILQGLYPAFNDLYVETSDSGISQVYVGEAGCGKFSAADLSDGTLRLLCLLVVLLDPKPALLTCIEEPEAGLHPEAIRLVADLLIEASERTQLIVTTHSPALVDALSGQPESVVVCERDDEGNSHLRRLKNEQLDTWLRDYSLGELWTMGEIGGDPQ